MTAADVRDHDPGTPDSVTSIDDRLRIRFEPLEIYVRCYRNHTGLREYLAERVWIGFEKPVGELDSLEPRFINAPDKCRKRIGTGT
jgi:hypothetical protein